MCLKKLCIQYAYKNKKKDFYFYAYIIYTCTSHVYPAVHVHGTGRCVFLKRVLLVHVPVVYNKI